MTTGMPDFGDLLAQAQQMSESMMAAQEGLADLEATGTAGGGLVTAVVDGHFDIRALTIAPEAYQPDDPDAWETIADLVIAAVRDAKAEAERLANEEMSAVTSGMGSLGGSLGGGLGQSLGDGEAAPPVGLPPGLESLLPPGLLSALDPASEADPARDDPDNLDDRGDRDDAGH